METNRFWIIASSVLAIFLIAWSAVPSFAQKAKPNILVIFGDDIGMYNISAYHRGMMGGRTPNIDRFANEGAYLRTITLNRVVPPGVQHLLPGNIPSEQDS